MVRHFNWGRTAMAGLAVLTALSVAGCGSTISGRAQSAEGAEVTSAPRTTPGKPAPTSRSAPTTTGGKTDFQADVGDCVTLGGTVDDATIAKAGCGSRASNYKVIGKTRRSAQCVSDRDSYYVETVNNIEQGAYCLDIDWVVDGCMDVGGDVVLRIECTSTGAKEGVRVIKIQQNASDVEVCDPGDRGFIKKERKFVVCVRDL